MPTEYDAIGSWSEIKLDILRDYAAPYSRIVSANGFHHHYIDGFAGPGSHISRKTGEPVPGSPLNALKTEPPFREYHFIDVDPRRIEQLRRYANRAENVHLYPGDCNEILVNRVLPLIRYKARHRALCVLDPYNIDLSWEVVASAGESKAVEIFLNFMVMDMNMNVLLRNPAKADPKQLTRMNRFWGDTSWQGVTYEESPQQQLFGEPDLIKVEDANKRVAEAYRDRLIRVAGFRYAPNPLALKNRLNRTIYYLFFASPNQTGNKIVEDILQRYRRP